MDTLSFAFDTERPLGGRRSDVLHGVVASGNLEVLMERVVAERRCEVEVATPVGGFDAVWSAVIEDFVARAQPGGLRVSINDGGARPDTVMLRLLQTARLMEAGE